MDSVVAIVLNRNRPDHLGKCLTKVRASETPCSIVVVDDASTDASVEIMRRDFPDCRLVVSRAQVGPSAARNLGIACAKENLPFDFLLFLDNDAFVAPSAVGQLVAMLKNDRSVGVAVPKAYQCLETRTLHLAGELKVSFAGGTIKDPGAGEIDRGQYDEPRYITACSGFTMLVRREVLERVGGFDEEFRDPAWEDVDFALRVSREGFRIAYVPTAIVEHVGGRLGRGPIREREQAKARNWFLLMRRYATPWQWLGFVVTFPVRAIARLARTACLDGPRAAGDQIKGVWRALGDSYSGRPRSPEE